MELSLVKVQLKEILTGDLPHPTYQRDFKGCFDTTWGSVYRAQDKERIYTFFLHSHMSMTFALNPRLRYLIYAHLFLNPSLKIGPKFYDEICWITTFKHLVKARLGRTHFRVK